MRNLEHSMGIEAFWRPLQNAEVWSALDLHNVQVSLYHKENIVFIVYSISDKKGEIKHNEQT